MNKVYTEHNLKLLVTSSLKEIETRTAKILMYEERVKKCIAAINKVGIPITKEIAMEVGNPYTLADKYGLDYSDKKCDKIFSLTTACDYLKENQVGLNRAQKTYETYLPFYEQAMRVRKVKEESSKPILAILTAQFAPFEEIYRKESIASHTLLYGRAQERKVALNARYEEIKVRLSKMGFANKERFPLMKERTEIKNTLAKRMYTCPTLEQYLAEVEQDIKEYWAYSINKLAEKLKRLNVDENAISVDEPEYTGRGFVVIIKEGTKRVFDARIIWAAEGSTLVTPHFRYIVTERKM